MASECRISGAGGRAELTPFSAISASIGVAAIWRNAGSKGGLAALCVVAARTGRPPFPAAVEQRQVLLCHAYALCQLARTHLVPRQHDVEVDDDCQDTAPRSSAHVLAASTAIAKVPLRRNASARTARRRQTRGHCRIRRTVARAAAACTGRPPPESGSPERYANAWLRGRAGQAEKRGKAEKFSPSSKAGLKQEQRLRGEKDRAHHDQRPHYPDKRGEVKKVDGQRAGRMTLLLPDLFLNR